MAETYPHKHSRKFRLPPAAKSHRSTIQQAPYYLARRLPFVAAGGTLSGGYAGPLDTPGQALEATAEQLYKALSHSIVTGYPLYVVRSYSTVIAWALAGEPFIVPEVRYSVTTSRHQNIVRSAASSVSAD